MKKKMCIVILLVMASLTAYSQSAQVFNLTKTHCDQINKEVKNLGNVIWGIIQYTNPEMVATKVTRNSINNGRQIGLCQIHEDLTSAYFGQFDANDVYGSILLAKTYLLNCREKKYPASYGVFFLLNGTNTPNAQKEYDAWMEKEYPKIIELANTFEGWGF